VVQDALNHPERLYPIIGILFFLLIVLYLQKIGERKGGFQSGSAYLGTTTHMTSMAETIEDLARRIILTHPTLDDGEQARMVRDELRLRGLKNVDLYEGSIFATIVRLKGGAARPPPPPPPPPPPGGRG
jgi:hypothetical protein